MSCLLIIPERKLMENAQKTVNNFLIDSLYPKCLVLRQQYNLRESFKTCLSIRKDWHLEAMKTSRI